MWLANNKKKKKTYVTVLEVEKSKIKMWQIWYVVRACCWAPRGLTSRCVITQPKGKGSSLGLFRKSANPTHEGSACTTWSPPRGSQVLILLHWGLEFLPVVLGGHSLQNILSQMWIQLLSNPSNKDSNMIHSSSFPVSPDPISGKG